MRFIFYNCLFETAEVETVTYLRFFFNKNFSHAVAKLSKVTKKRKLREAALGFSKRKKETGKVVSVVNL